MATNLLDIDLDEEIRRQKAISSLLAQQPEAQPQSEADQQPEEQPKEVKPPATVTDAYGDWRKWPSISPEQAADIPTIDQPPAPAGHVDLAPPGHIDLAPPQQASTVPVPTPPEGIQTDPETGTRYVTDEGTGTKVPYAEPATAADKEAFKPGDVTLPQVTTEGTAEVQPAPDKLDQVERATLVKLPTPPAPVKPAPGKLTQVEKALPVFPTGPKAPGAHTELAPPGQMDLRPDTDVVPTPTVKPPAQPASTQTQPASTQTQPAQPTQPAAQPVADNWKTWTTIDGTQADPSFVQPKPPTSVDTLKAGEGNTVDPGQLYSYLLGKFANSGLVGYVPPDGARWGIKTGSAAEWAAFGLAVAKQESGLNTRSYNASDPGGSAGLFQFGQGQTQFTKGGDQFDPQESADAFVRSVEHYVANKGSVANMGETFGSIRRPNEAGQYISYAQEIAAKSGTQQPAAQQPKKEEWESWGTLSPEQETQAVQSKQVDDVTTLNDGLNKSGNLIAYYKTLDANPPKDVRPEVVNSFKANLQKTITEEMQKRFPEMTTEVAWQKAQEDSTLWDIGAEFLHQGQASFAQLAPVFAQRSADKEQVDAFFENVMPGASDADKQAFLAKVHGLPREQQGPLIASMLPAPQAGQRGNDPMAVLTAIDHLSDPDYQAAQAKKLADAREFAEKAATEDPRLQGSAGEAVAQSAAAAEQIMAYYGIPIIGAAQAAEETRRALAKEHPDWDEAKLDQESAYSSLAKVYGNTVAAAVMANGADVLLKTLTTPWKRAAGQVLAGTLTNMGISGGTTIATNIAEGKPAMQGVEQSAVTGAIQGALLGSVHGAGELLAKPEVPVTAPEVKAPEPPVPVTREQRDQILGLKPVTQEETTGPNVPESSSLTSASLGTEARRYETEPVVTRGTERTTFTPAELAAQAGTLAGRTPEELQAEAERLTPQTNFNQRAVWFLGDEGNQETQQAQRTQAPSPPPSPPPTLEEAIQQQRRAAAAAALGEKPAPQRTEAIPPPRVGESDPYTSRIANRYTAERMATGELGQIDSSQGQSTEHLVMQGLKMTPAQREGLIDNLTKGKGGDLDQQGAAIRSKEALLSIQSKDASRAAAADPTNAQLQAQAKAAHDAVTAFHNGPVKKFKKVWSDAGRGLQREIPLDYTTLNGMKEAYLKGKGNGTDAPPEFVPRLKQMADTVTKSSNAERAAMNNLGTEIERQTRGKTLPDTDLVRVRLMEIMKDLPCRT
jgi:hypothetical protein